MVVSGDYDPFLSVFKWESIKSKFKNESDWMWMSWFDLLESLEVNINI